MDNWLQLLHQHWLLHFVLLHYRDVSHLSLNLMDQPLLVSHFSSAASPPLSAFTELKSNRAFLWITPWLKGMLGFPGGSEVKVSACNTGNLGSIPGLGRSPGDVKGYRLQYSGLENFMDYTVHGVTKSRTQLSDFHFHFLSKESCW